MLKKILILLMIGIMLCIPVAVAAESHTETAIRELSSLGVISAEDMTSEKLNTPTTRGEFSQYLIRLMDLAELESSMSFVGMYSDVSSHAPYARSVELLSQLGLISGTGEHTFSPESPVTMEQASKMILCALGYNVVAENAGGWPNGYTSTAVKTGLLEGVKTSNGFNCEQVLIMLKNALDIDMVVNTSISPSTSYYEVMPGETLRLRLMTESAGDVAYKLSGVVSATPYSYTVLQIPDLENDEVVIDNVIYRVGTTNAEMYFGQKVDFYAVERNDEMVLVSIVPSSQNKIYHIDSDDLNYINKDVISYKKDNNNKQSVNVEANATFLYNGSPVRKENLSNYPLVNGYIDAIDNDTDKSADIVQIWNHVDVPVADINENLFRFKTGYTLNGASTLFYDKESKEKKFLLIDENGQITTPAKLNDDIVLSVFVNEDADRYAIYVSSKSVTGRIEAYDDETITINGADYPIMQNTVYEFGLGDEVTAYMNYFGQISYMEKIESEGTYGYVSRFGDYSLSSGVELQIVTAADVSFRSEEKADANDVYATNEVPVLVCSNEGIFCFETADNVRVNGEKVSSRELASYVSEEDIIFFKTNSNGEITYIEVLEMCAGSYGTASKYDVYDKVFGGPGIQNGIALNEDSKVIAIPLGGATSDDDYMVKIVVRADDNYAGHLARGYDYDPLTKKVNLVVVTKRMVASDVVLPYLSASKPSMVVDVKNVYNEETDEYDKRITILKNGEEKTYLTEEIIGKNAVLGTISKGDIIVYVESLNEKMANAIKFTSIDKISGDIKKYNSSYDYTELSGMATEISMNDVDALNYRLVHTVILNINGNPTSVKFPVRKSIPVYMYDTDTGEIRKSSLEEIIPGSDRLYMILDGSDSPLACTIIRD